MTTSTDLEELEKRLSNKADYMIHW